MKNVRKPAVIPAIDLLGGRCVRLYQGDFQQVTGYDDEPRELAARYRAAGLARLHVVDLDGARTGEPANMAMIAELASAGVSVQAGGGIRDLDRLRQLLAAGADRAVIGSVAVNDPEQVCRWINDVGPERVVLAFDVRLDDHDEPVVATHGWTRHSGQSLWPLVEFFLDRGADQYLCTDISRDGTLTGPNTELYRACTARYPDGQFLASGGVSGVADLNALAATGVAGIITGKALLDGRLSLTEIGRFLRDA